jgi:hypothetical protein
MEKGQHEIAYYPRLSEHPAQECRPTTRSKYAVHLQAAAFLERRSPKKMRQEIQQQLKRVKCRWWVGWI